MNRIIVAAGSLLVLASAAHAQAPPALELRAGMAQPTEDLVTSELKLGFGFGATVSVPLYAHMRVYAGWDWFHFETNQAFAGSSFDVENTGYSGGLAFQHPLPGGRADAWLKGGAIYKHLELENEGGDVTSDTGHELGWEAGGGLIIPLSPRLAVSPGMRYRSFSADLTLDGTTYPVDTRYVTAELGVVFSFGPRTTAVTRTR